MALAGEISVRIGADNTQLKSKLSDSEKAVRSFGKGLANQFLGSGFGTAVATALGINLKSISDQIARLVTGVNKEVEAGLKNYVALSTQVADQQIAANRARLTAEQRYQLALVDQERLQQRIAENQGRTLAEQIAGQRDHLALLAAEAEIRAHNARIQAEADRAYQAAIGRSISLAEAQRSAELQTLTAADRVARIRTDIIDLEGAINSRLLNQADNERFLNTLNQRRIELIGAQAEARKEAIDLAAKEAAEQERIERAQQEIFNATQRDLDERAAKNAEIARLQLKGVENLTAAEQVQLDLLTGKLGKRQAEKEIADLLAKGVQNLNETEKNRLAALTGVTRELKQQTEEYAQQVELARSLVTITGRGSRELSDRELQRKISTLQSEVATRTSRLTASGGFFDPLLTLQQRDLQTSLDELNLRRDVRRQVAAFGDARAFNNFPGITEARFAEILRGAGQNDRTLAAIEKTNRLLQDGITVRSI